MHFPECPAVRAISISPCVCRPALAIGAIFRGPGVFLIKTVSLLRAIAVLTSPSTWSNSVRCSADEIKSCSGDASEGCHRAPETSCCPSSRADVRHGADMRAGRRGIRMCFYESSGAQRYLEIPPGSPCTASSCNVTSTVLPFARHDNGQIVRRMNESAQLSRQCVCF